MTTNLLGGGGKAEVPSNEFNMLATVKKASAKIFLDSVDFHPPF